MTSQERRALLQEVGAMIAQGDLQLGEAARVLRSAVLGMDRQTFAQRVKVSERAIANLEDDPRANPTVETLSRVFGPFGGRLSLSFPHLEQPVPLDDDARRRRELIRGGLAKSRRRRRSGTGG